MTPDSATAPLVVGIVLALWLAAACWALLTGLSLRSGAARAVREAERARAVLAGSPALALLVGSDGRIDAGERLADWLGLERLPRFLADLSTPDSGIASEDLDLLSRQVTAAQKAGKSFSMPIAARGSSRALLVRGGPAPAGVAGRDAALLWIFDATESEARIAALGAEADRLSTAFEALSALIEAAPFPMWYRGADYRLSLVNSAYVRAVEAETADAVIEGGVELVENASGGSPLSAAAAALEAGRPVSRTVPATISGERRMMRIVDVPIGDGGIAGYAIDIEETEQARAAFRRFSSAQRDMLDRLSAGVAQFGADRSLLFSNQPFQRIFGLKPEWIAERPEFDRVLERMREADRLPEVRDFPSWKAERREWFQVASEAVEENWALPGGQHLRVVAQPLPDGGLLTIFEDRTEQLQLASARDTLLRVRAATFDNLFEGIAVFASDGRLQLWNSKFVSLWGFDAAALDDHPRVDALVARIAPLLSDPKRARLIRELVSIAATDRRQQRGRVQLRDGRVFDFAAVPLPDGNALFTLLDVTDSSRIENALRERNDALEAADRIKTAFVENMSYELRTPLTSIGGFAEMLAGGYAGALTAQANDYVAAILESVARLGVLVDRVLDLTQEASADPVGDDPVDLAPLIDSAVRAVAKQASAKAIDLVVDREPSLGNARGDARRIGQAIDHVLSHAIAHTPEAGRVLVHARGDLGGARIVISDNGPGMSADDVARAFDRFSRAGEMRDADDALGLGLPLARQFIEAHGGTLVLTSEPGAGSMFEILLPR